MPPRLFFNNVNISSPYKMLIRTSHKVQCIKQTTPPPLNTFAIPNSYDSKRLLSVDFQTGKEATSS